MAGRKNRRNVNPDLMRDIIESYDVRSAKDLQEALKDLMGGALEGQITMLL